MTIPYLKDPDEFFTNPKPNTIMEEVHAEMAEHSLEWEMAQRKQDAWVGEIMHMVVGAEVPTDKQ
jgi:hypothetical protein